MILACPCGRELTWDDDVAPERILKDVVAHYRMNHGTGYVLKELEAWRAMLEDKISEDRYVVRRIDVFREAFKKAKREAKASREGES